MVSELYGISGWDSLQMTGKDGVNVILNLLKSLVDWHPTEIVIEI
jgi:hypothetical protein